MADTLKLYIVLSRAYRAILAHDTQDVRRHDLNLTEFAVLELLYHKGPQPLQQIGDKILITTGTITYVVDKLEQKGLLFRQVCEKDRRKMYAVLTETGASFIERIFPDHEQALKYAAGGLTDEEKQMAIHLLKKLGLEAEERLPKNKKKER